MGCSDWLYSVFDLWVVILWGLYLYGVVFCAFVRSLFLLCVFVVWWDACLVVMYCSCGMLFVLSLLFLFGCIVCLAVCLFCCGSHVLLLVHWLGLNVIGLVFVVGWERGVVGNGVLDGFLYYG